MRWKKLLKTTAISVGSIVAIVLVAFSVFVYNPFEGRFKEIRQAVPTTVDFFVAKKRLVEDFDQFPKPRFWHSIAEAAWWSRLSQGRFFRSRAAQAERAVWQIEDVQRELEAIPLIGLHILADGIGTDLALVGRLRSTGRGFEICAYSRVSWKIRAALGLLAYDFVRSRVGGAKITVEEDGIYRIEAPGAQPAFVTKVRDLVIAGNSLALVKSSRDLALGVSDEDVMYASADYNDELITPVAEWSERTGQAPNVLETMVDADMLRRWMPRFATWPGGTSDITREERLLDAFINQKAMRRLWTSFLFESPAGLSALLHLNVNHGQLTEFQKRFHNEPPADVKRWLEPFLSHVPSTAAMAAILRVPVGAFLHEMFMVLDNDTRELIQEGFRRSGIKGGVQSLIGRISPGVEPWVGIIFRNNDYPPIKNEFKVYIRSPAPAWALIFRASRGGEGRIEGLITEFREKLRYNMEFTGPGMQLRSGPGDQVLIQEWANRHIEGTGQIALFFDGAGPRRYFFISNSGKLLREVVNTRYHLGGSRPIAARGYAAEVIDQLPDKLSGFCVLQGDRVRNVLTRYQDFARRATAEETYDQIWAASVRPGIEQEIFAQFRGRYRSVAALRGADKQRFEELVEQRLRSLWSRERVKLGKDLDRSFSEAQSWLDYLDAAYLTVRARPKDLRLELRIFPRW